MASRKNAHLLAALVSVSATASAGTSRSEPAAQIPVPVPRPVVAAAPGPDVAPDPATLRPGARTVVGRPYRTLLDREARKHGLPTDIADAVAAIESGYESSAIGAVGEIGLMQIRPSTAAMLGFAGDPAELAEPEVNIRYGVAYLAQAWRLANGDLCRTLMKYRAGHGEEAMTPLSVQYCGRARAHLASVGSPLADMASVPAVTAPRELEPRDLEPIAPRNPAARRGHRTASTSAAFWARHEARVRAITARIHAKWRRMASR